MLTTLGSSGFGMSSDIDKISMPNLKKLDGVLFSSNLKIVEIEIVIPDTELAKLGTLKIEKMTLTNTDKMENASETNGLRAFPNLKEFKSNSESVGDDVLSALKTIQSVEMPNATNFGKNAFSGATSLSKITLPKASERMHSDN